jgi:drug/metabolite transporter (DMT)-like permease
MKGSVLAFLSCAFFGLGYIFRKLLVSSLSPVVITAFTSVFSALILLFFMEVFHKIWELRVLHKREFWAIIAVGFFSGFLAEVIFLVGLKGAYVSNAVLLSRTNPLFMALMATVVFKEKVSFHQIAGSVIMIFGLFVIATQGFVLGFSYRIGDLLLISAGFLWALGNTIMKKYLDHVPPEVILLGKSIVGCGALVFIFEEKLVTASSVTLNTVLFFGLFVFSFIMAYLLWYKALELTSECNVALTSLSVPLFTVIFAHLFLGEFIGGYQFFGGALILFGLFVLEVHLDQIASLKNRVKIGRLLHL